MSVAEVLSTVRLIHGELHAGKVPAQSSAPVEEVTRVRWGKDKRRGSRVEEPFQELYRDPEEGSQIRCFVGQRDSDLVICELVLSKPVRVRKGPLE